MARHRKHARHDMPGDGRPDHGAPHHPPPSHGDPAHGNGAAHRGPDRYAVLVGSTLPFNHEPWLYDGRDLRLLSEIGPGPVGSSPGPFFASSGLLFFKAYGPGEDAELYVSDVRTGDLQRVDINPSGSSYAGLSGFAALGDRVYFMADDGLHGRELWSYDICAGRAALAADINPGGDAYVENLIAVRGALYFAAYTAEFGYELWMYDPGEGEAVLVADINPNGSSLQGLGMAFVELGGALYFFATTTGPGGAVDIELHRHDTVSGVTERVADITPFGPSFVSSDSAMAVLDGALYFGAQDPAHGAELWVYVPKEDRLAVIDDIAPGPASSGAGLYGVRDLRGEIYFAADDGVHGRELWAFDPKAQSSRLVADIAAGAEGAFLGIDPTFTEFRGKLYFAARTAEAGYDLFVYDPVADEVTSFDLVPGDADSMVLVYGAVGRQLLVAVTEELGEGLVWRVAVSDGVPRDAADFEVLDAAGVPFDHLAADAFIF